MDLESGFSELVTAKSGIQDWNGTAPLTFAIQVLYEPLVTKSIVSSELES
jgi:hypothetical protein